MASAYDLSTPEGRALHAMSEVIAAHLLGRLSADAAVRQVMGLHQSAHCERLGMRHAPDVAAMIEAAVRRHS